MTKLTEMFIREANGQGHGNGSGKWYIPVGDAYGGHEMFGLLGPFSSEQAAKAEIKKLEQAGLHPDAIWEPVEVYSVDQFKASHAWLFEIGDEEGEPEEL